MQILRKERYYCSTAVGVPHSYPREAHLRVLIRSSSCNVLRDEKCWFKANASNYRREQTKFGVEGAFGSFAVYTENCDPASWIVVVGEENPQKFGSQSTSESRGFPEESKFLVLFQHSFAPSDTSVGTHTLSGGTAIALLATLLISLRGLHIFVTSSFMHSGPQ